MADRQLLVDRRNDPRGDFDQPGLAVRTEIEAERVAIDEAIEIAAIDDRDLDPTETWHVDRGAIMQDERFDVAEG